MGRIGIHWHIEITILTVFWFLSAAPFMGFELIRWEGFLAMRTLLLPMVLLLMLFLEINVVELVALWTLFDVPTAVTEMCSHFALGKVLEAVLAPLNRFILHIT